MTPPMQKPSGVSPWQASLRCAASRSGQDGRIERAGGNARIPRGAGISGVGKGLMKSYCNVLTVVFGLRLVS